jgi:hypothetical protein
VYWRRFSAGEALQALVNDLKPLYGGSNISRINRD